MVTVATLVGDEMERFLPSWIDAVEQFADRVVIIDNSADGSGDFLRDRGCEVTKGDFPANRIGAGKQAAFDAALDGSEWVICIDADQIPATDFRPYLEGDWVAFNIYDLWDADHYRSDAYWQGHNNWIWHAINVRNHQGFEWVWGDPGWHGTHIPLNVTEIGCDLVRLPAECGLLHYAYVTPELRKAKWKHYIRIASQLTAFQRDHANTIRSPNPHLEALPFEPTWRLRLAT